VSSAVNDYSDAVIAEQTTAGTSLTAVSSHAVSCTRPSAIGRSVGRSRDEGRGARVTRIGVVVYPA
jgi:hypothetical protein